MKKLNLKTKETNSKGITLVALIITIIILLVLATVSINLVINGGILDKSKSAVDKYSDEELMEQIKLAYQEYQILQYTGETEDVDIFIQNKLNSIYQLGKIKKIKKEEEILVVELVDGKQYIYDTLTGKSEEYADPFNYGDKTKATLVQGDDIILGTEKFKVFSVSNGEIKAMPYYNLVTVTEDGTVKQGPAVSTKTTDIQSAFSTEKYWAQGEDAIDMNNTKNLIQQYIVAYKKTLEKLGAKGITVRAAKRSELLEEGVTAIMRNPGLSGHFCPCSGHTGGADWFWFVEGNR